MTVSEYKVIISREALEMLKEHIAFLSNVNKKAAEKTKDSLIAAIGELSAMPRRYSFFNEPYIPQNKYRKMFVKTRYLVLYQIVEDTVYVDYILDCRQDYGWLIK